MDRVMVQRGRRGYSRGSHDGVEELLDEEGSTGEGSSLTRSRSFQRDSFLDDTAMLLHLSESWDDCMR